MSTKTSRQRGIKCTSATDLFKNDSQKLLPRVVVGRANSVRELVGLFLHNTFTTNNVSISIPKNGSNSQNELL